MSLTAWIAFTLAYTLMAAAPAPVILLVVSYAIAYGRRTAASVVAGTVLGDATCLAAAVFGAGALLATSAVAFTALKLAGAAYLVFLGLKLWKAPPVPAAIDAGARPRSPGKSFLHAWLTTVFNPKSVLFFMVFAPQFMGLHARFLPELAAMEASVLAAGIMVDGSYSAFAAGLRRFIRAPGAQRTVNRLTGGTLVAEGVLAAFWRSVAL
ncbi:MAG: LysE family translocator [Rhodospirillales bacterium]|nr:LysE family translocator [Rhodospirillales bacterium]